MAHQSLDHNEILNVRWATVDPNPMAQAREARKIEEQAAEAVRRALPAEFVAEIEGRDPEARKRKRIEGSFGLQGYDAPDEVWYARTREVEIQQHIEGRQEQLLGIEDAPREEDKQADDDRGGGGLLSSSTLAALKGVTTQMGGKVITSQTATGTSSGGGGPLVAYGSDEDSD